MTDKIKNGEVKVAYCPTKDMLGNVFTKLLQGSALIRLQAKILNLPSSGVNTVHRSVLRIDRNNAIHESGKDTSKDAGSWKAPRGSNRNNATNVKWAKVTKEGNMDSKPSK